MLPSRKRTQGGASLCPGLSPFAPLGRTDRSQPPRASPGLPLAAFGGFPSLWTALTRCILTLDPLQSLDRPIFKTRRPTIFPPP